MKQRVKEWVKFKTKIIFPIIQFFVELAFVISSSFLATDTFFGMNIDENGTFIEVMEWIWMISLTLKVGSFISNHMTIKKLQKIEMAEKLSNAMLEVQHRANEYKTRHVLQITYGSVQKWHPFNFYNNVLVYDVHEQIRTILLELKNAIISITPGLDADAVTIDLVYCYPSKDNNDGKIPVDKDKLERWKLISSRDSSSMNYKVHDFLSSSESFYFYLNQNNYVFFNDKLKNGRYYIPSGKDQEYGRTGSVVGLTLNVKNDVPENVLVKAMITITTYGRKLNEKGDPVSEQDYKDMFKKNVLNGYKSLLESELSQMYIRHMIREGGMCPHSGMVFAKSENGETKDGKITLNPKDCPHKKSQGTCNLLKLPCEQNKGNKS